MDWRTILHKMNIFGQARKEYREIKDRDTIKEAVSDFNIVRTDGVDYIVYGTTIVSRAGDDDLLERLNEYREKHIKKKLSGA